MHFLIWETLSFNLIYVAACYPVGTGMCHNMVGLLQHYNCPLTGEISFGSHDIGWIEPQGRGGGYSDIFTHT